MQLLAFDVHFPKFLQKFPEQADVKACKTKWISGDNWFQLKKRLRTTHVRVLTSTSASYQSNAFLHVEDATETAIVQDALTNNTAVNVCCFFYGCRN